MEINKVVFGSDTIMDISDTTASEGDVLATKYFYTAAGVRTAGMAQALTIDSALSTTSENPVQNKVITQKVGLDSLNTVAQDLSGAVNEILGAIPSTATDVGAIATPTSAASGSLLGYNGLSWVGVAPPSFVDIVPSSGIPSSALSASVQSSLALANTALQSAPEEIFWAMEGETDFSDIYNAYFDNKTILAKDFDGNIYILTEVSGMGYCLFHNISQDVFNNQRYVYWLYLDGGGWDSGSELIGTYSKPANGIPASDIATGVIPSASSATPYNAGTASAGTSAYFARADHVHNTQLIEAIYGSTTASEIVGNFVIINNYIAIYCIYNNIYHWLTSYSFGGGSFPYMAKFTGISNNTLSFLTVNENIWSSSSYTLPSASNATPQALGTASAGSSSDFSRSDHVHPKPDPILWSGVCYTEEEITAKAASIVRFAELKSGQVFIIKFDYAVPAGSTLDINNTGAKNISYHNSNIIDGIIKANDRVTFYYGGTVFNIIAIDRQPSASDVGAIAAPASASDGDILAYSSNLDMWVAQNQPTEIYWATYNITTTAEVEAAYQAGKLICVVKDYCTYMMSQRNSEINHQFTSLNGYFSHYVSLNDDVWSAGATYTLARTSQIPSASDTTPQTLGEAAAGTASNFSRSDHVHAMPSALDVGIFMGTATPTTGDIAPGQIYLKYS